MALNRRTPRPELLTRGRELLDRWLSETGKTEVELADVLDVTKGTVNNWRNGHVSPEWAYRVALEKLSDGRIPADSWKTGREEAILARAETAKPTSEAA